MGMYQVRWMIRRDMPDVLDIERQCFDLPWTEDQFLTHLRQLNCIGMVAEHGDKIVGYMMYELEKTSLRLLNFAVSPQSRRQGVGAAMVAKLRGELAQQRRTSIRVYARERNLAAQQFWRAMGFRAEAVVRGYYEDTGEDAYAMRYVIEDEPQPREPRNRIKGLV